MRKCIGGFLDRMFNPFVIDMDTYRKLSKLHLNQNLNLNYVNEQIAKYSIDPNKVNLGILSKLTFTEQSSFSTLSKDDIFLLLITFLLFSIIVFKNLKMYSKFIGKIATKTKKDLKETRKLFNYILGFIYIIYSVYMIKLIFSDKQYILSSRIVSIMTYSLAGGSILLSFFSFLSD